ncbi:MAG: M56 family metallopeptidase [Thermomonas sp.]
MTDADLFAALCETTVAGSAAILMVLALRLPLRNAFGAGVAHSAWALVPLAMLAVLLPAAQVPVLAMPAIAMPVDVSNLVVDDMPHASIDIVRWLVIFAGCGALASMFWMFLQQHRFVRGLGRLAAAGDGVFIAESTDGLPAVMGLIRPRILLPADAMHRYDACERDLMLAHERAHIARGDLLANAVVAAVRCLFWFNPLVHIAARRFRDDQELACDAHVVQRHPQARRAYGEAMLKTQLARGALPLGCHWAQAHPLRERIEMLKQPLPSLRRRMLGGAVAIGLSLVTGYAAWAGQPSQPSISTVPAGKIAADIALRVDDGAPVRMRAVADAGVPFSVSDDEGGKHYAIEGTVTRMQHAGEPALALDLRIVEGSGQDAGPKLVRQIASPKIVVSNGKSAQIHVGEEVADTAGHTVFKGVRLDIVLTDSMPVAMRAPRSKSTRAASTNRKPTAIPASQAFASKPAQWTSYDGMLQSFSASWTPTKPQQDDC